MNRGGKRKTFKKTYKKKSGRKYKKYNKSSFYPTNSSTNINFIRKVKRVVNKTLHPEKKRYNCLRVNSNTTKNVNWAINGIKIKSLDVNTSLPVSDTDGGNRAPWRWYQLNAKPVLASSDTFYSMEGSKINLKYIYLKGYVIFKKLNNNNASALEVLTRLGHLRLRIACCRGESMNTTLLNKYNEFYDNVEVDASKPSGIRLINDESLWKAYHLMTRRQYAYKNLKIWTAKKWKWNRWNKAQSAQGPIVDSTGTIVPHADTGDDELMIPFNYIIRVNKDIIYRQTTDNIIDGDDEANLKYFYCFEADCGVENFEYEINLGGVGVFTDC